MQLKPAITKTLSERKVVLSGKIGAIQLNLVESDRLAAQMRKELEVAQTEIADIDEFLSAPKEE